MFDAYVRLTRTSNPDYRVLRVILHLEIIDMHRKDRLHMELEGEGFLLPFVTVYLDQHRINILSYFSYHLVQIQKWLYKSPVIFIDRLSSIFEYSNQTVYYK
jgi:hypothetical protein